MNLVRKFLCNGADERQMADFKMSKGCGKIMIKDYEWRKQSLWRMS